MKMRETSRAQDKEPADNNNLFLNPDRVSMPDIDVDIEETRRGEVIQYLYDKYGTDKVCHIGTYGTLSLKAVIKDVARALDISFEIVNNITKNIPDEIESITDIEQSDLIIQIDNLLGEEKRKQLLSIAKILYDLKRHPSIHAAGVVLSPIPLDQIVPVRIQDGDIVTQWEMEDIEHIGLIKFDLLGLRTLSVVEECVKMCNIDLDQISFEDEKAWELIRNGSTIGCFQFESPGIRKLLRDMQASTFEDLVAINALYRPGPLNAKDEQGKTMVEHYVDRKLGFEPVEYDHPLLESILKNTFGIIVYQEQLMEIAKVLAGYTMSEADELRKGVAKKKTDIVVHHHQKFVEGCVKNGIKQDVAENIWGQIETFAEYGFNRSHSCSYSYLSYFTAYLKANYPLQYMTCVLNSIIDKQDKIAYYLQECLRMGLKILPPDINKSYFNFSLEGDAIRYGLGAIKKVSSQFVDVLVKERQKDPIRSLKDLIIRINRSVMRKDLLINLILAGTLDSIEPYTNKSALCQTVEDIYKYLTKSQQKLKKGKITEEQIKTYIEDYSLPDNLKLYSKQELEAYEKDILGFPLTKYLMSTEKLRKTQSKCTNLIADVPALKNGKQLIVTGIVEGLKNYPVKTGKYKNKPLYTFFLNDLDSSVKCIVYPSQNIKVNFKEGDLIAVKAQKTTEENGRPLLIIKQYRKIS
jgi:DNA polymerase-3 subunit alpha